MNFDYTYITLAGFKVFEPMVLLTNFLFFVTGLYCNSKLKYFKEKNARNLKHLKAIEKQMYNRAEYINNLYFENEMNIELKRLIDSEDWNRLTPDILK